MTAVNYVTASSLVFFFFENSRVTVLSTASHQERGHFVWTTEKRSTAPGLQTVRSFRESFDEIPLTAGGPITLLKWGEKRVLTAGI